MKERGCYEGVGRGYCRNRFYRTIGVTHLWRSNSITGPSAPHDRRCLKHWLQWQNTLMSNLFGADWREWIGTDDYPT